MNFSTYLEKEGFSSRSRKSYVYQSERFMRWALQEQVALAAVNYPCAVAYVAYLKTQHSNIRTINSKIAGTRQYFNYLMATGCVAANPFSTLWVRGETSQKMLTGLLSREELEDLYYNYPVDADPRGYARRARKRNKVMVGLMVYQGLRTVEMARLETGHIALHKGRLHIPGGRMGARRDLALQSWQVLDLMEYLQEIRPALCRGGKEGCEDLFPVAGGRLTDTVGGIMKTLKTMNRKITKPHQLRASVIVQWLTMYNLREVQVMAGHRRISTTERYLQEDLKQLQDMVSTYHPLR
ncbi:tyrosine-type recombinase/integrase [Ascidiimonas aurantiaca]|uniref:tyrosine-type recombinase/integrase n=1 Tax=Ascidiimonas aurantiaca TaxID=1685432 RepID=UPI0030EC522D